VQRGKRTSQRGERAIVHRYHKVCRMLWSYSTIIPPLAPLSDG
jgi:hypothetical protein